MLARIARTATFAVALLVVTGLARGNEFFVDPKAPGTQTGADWPNAFHTIQEAIDAAHAATGEHDVMVAEAIYSTPDTGSRDDTIVFKTSSDGKKVRMHGAYKGCDDAVTCGNPGSEDPVSPDGSIARTVLTADSGVDVDYHVMLADGEPGSDYLFELFTVDGFTVRDGRADGVGGLRNHGGGLICTEEAMVRLENMVFEDNIASDQGGAVRYSGKETSLLQVANSTFIRNVATEGGAMALMRVPQIVMGNVHFYGNGNVQEDVTGATPITQRGGALYFEEETHLNCQNGLFYDNTSLEGSVSYRIPLLSAGHGADLTHTWINCTFAFNTAAPAVLPPPPGTSMEAAIEVEADSTDNLSDLLLYNSIFWGNDPGPDLAIGAGMSVFIDHTNWDMDTSASLATFTTTADTSVDPEFLDPAARNLRLMSTSTLIDAGSNALVGADEADVDEDGDPLETLPLDLDLHRRIEDSVVDMGAYED